MNLDLKGCVQGDSEAWSQFCDQTIRLVVASIRRVCPSGKTPSGEDMDDLVQAVYVKLLRNDRRLLRSYDPSRASISTWITLIARSVTIDALRKKSLETRPLDEASATPENTPGHTTPDMPPIPTSILTARQRLVLSMLFEDGLEIADVAKVLDVNPQTIRSTKHKAMERLRAHFGDSNSRDGATQSSVQRKDEP